MLLSDSSENARFVALGDYMIHVSKKIRRLGNTPNQICFEDEIQFIT